MTWPGGFRAVVIVSTTDLFYDEFTSDGAISGTRACEPGPGGWAVAYGIDWEILSGILICNPASAGWTNKCLIGDASSLITRNPGTVLKWRGQFGTAPAGDGGMLVGWNSRANLTDPNQGNLGAWEMRTADRPYIWTGNASVDIHMDQAASGAFHEWAVVLRNTGAFFFYRDNLAGGAGPWELKYVIDEWSGTSVGPGTPFVNVNNVSDDMSWLVDNLQVPQTLWEPVPLLSDSFDRANNTDLGNTDGAAHEEANGGAGITWNKVNGDWQISSNELQTLGAQPANPRYLVNAEVGAADVFIDCRMSMGPASTNTFGPGVRFDMSSGVRVTHRIDTQRLGLWDWDGAAFNLLSDTRLASATGSNDRLVAIATGDQIIAIVNDGQDSVRVTSLVSTVKTVHGMTSVADASAVLKYAIWPLTFSEPATQEEVEAAGVTWPAGDQSGRPLPPSINQQTQEPDPFSEHFWVEANEEYVNDPIDGDYYQPDLGDFGTEERSWAQIGPPGSRRTVHIRTTPAGKAAVLAHPGVLEIDDPTVLTNISQWVDVGTRTVRDFRSR